MPLASLADKSTCALINCSLLCRADEMSLSSGQGQQPAQRRGMRPGTKLHKHVWNLSKQVGPCLSSDQLQPALYKIGQWRQYADKQLLLTADSPHVSAWKHQHVAMMTRSS